MVICVFCLVGSLVIFRCLVVCSLSGQLFVFCLVVCPLFCLVGCLCSVWLVVCSFFPRWLCIFCLVGCLLGVCLVNILLAGCLFILLSWSSVRFLTFAGCLSLYVIDCLLFVA